MTYLNHPQSLFDQGWCAGYDGDAYPNLEGLTPAQSRDLSAGYLEGLHDQDDESLRYYQRTGR
jgi:hypothetical protein